MSLWSDGKIIELLEAVRLLTERVAVLELDRADAKKSDRSVEPRRANAR